MRVTKKIAKTNLKLNKKRTIITIVGIILSVALITALSTLISSFKESLYRFYIQERGYFHYVFYDVDDDNLEDEVSKFLEGFKLMYKQIKDLLEKFEVKEIDCLGKEFDPALEQAVVMDHDETKESGVVTVVLQKGYMYKDRVLRTAMVKVNE